MLINRDGGVLEDFRGLGSWKSRAVAGPSSPLVILKSWVLDGFRLWGLGL